MQRTTELHVDERRYQSTQYSATFGLRLMHKLVKVAGKPLGMLVSSDMKSNVTPDFIGSMVGALTETLDEDTFINLIYDITSTTQVQDEKGYRPITAETFNVDFAGAYGHLFKLVKEVLAFQYGDFFAALAVQVDERQATPSTKKTQRIKAKK